MSNQSSLDLSFSSMKEENGTCHRVTVRTGRVKTHEAPRTVLGREKVPGMSATRTLLVTLQKHDPQRASTGRGGRGPGDGLCKYAEALMSRTPGPEAGGRGSLRPARTRQTGHAPFSPRLLFVFRHLDPHKGQRVPAPKTPSGSHKRWTRGFTPTPPLKTAEAHRE